MSYFLIYAGSAKNIGSGDFIYIINTTIYIMKIVNTTLLSIIKVDILFI